MIAQSAPEVRQALDRALAFFRDRETRPGVLARRIVGRPGRDDPQLVDHLVRERRRRTRIDGSMDGSLMKTAWVAWEFLDLECPSDHAAVVRTVGYVLAQQDRPGHFGEGCDAERHAAGLCHHTLRGFFSPGTADVAMSPARFPSGLVVEPEAEARFAVSCFALRTVLRAGEDRRSSVRNHVDGLVELLDRWETLPQSLSPDLQFFALGALALAPIEYRAGLESVTARIVSRQEPTGGWSGVDLFHALEMLLSVPNPAARDALRRAAALLCGLQHASGAFDAAESEEQALIAARVLRTAL